MPRICTRIVLYLPMTDMVKAFHLCYMDLTMNSKNIKRPCKIYITFDVIQQTPIVLLT